LIEHIFLRFR